MPTCFTPFFLSFFLSFFNAPWQFSPLLNLPSVNSRFNAGWLAAQVHFVGRVRISRRRTKVGGHELTYSTLRQSQRVRRLVWNTWFICIPFFFLPSNTSRSKKTDTRLNNGNINGSNINGLDLIKCLRSKTCRSEFNNPWQNICDRDDVENLLSVTSLISTT